MAHFKYIFEPSSSFLKESYIKRNEIAIACVIMNASLQDIHNFPQSQFILEVTYSLVGATVSRHNILINEQIQSPAYFAVRFFFFNILMHLRAFLF